MQRGLRLKLPAPELCTDNAAMIGSAARFGTPMPYPEYLGYDAFASGSPGGRGVILTVYSRPDCHLCEEALETIRGLRAEGYRFELREVDIESDERLLRRYLERIPVVLLDGEVDLRAGPRSGRASGQSRYCDGMIEPGTIETDGTGSGLAADGERLSLGVAARLSRYLQVLTQARKMGRETISSQELSEYTHINPTQIRRDLSGFGKFGKRGVGYNVDSLVSEIRKILRTSGKHNIALFGAGNLGQAIASSDIFADHGFQIVAIFDVDPELVGMRAGGDGGPRLQRDRRGRLRGGDRGRRPRGARGSGPGRRGPLGRGRGEDHLQLLRAAAARAARGDGPYLQPRSGPPLRALLLPGLNALADAGLDLDRARETFEGSTDFTIGLEEEFAIVDPQTLELQHRFEDLHAACLADEVLAESAAGELISSEIEIRSGRSETFSEAIERQRERRARLFRLSAEMGLGLAATGTHPWADYLDQVIIDTPHYERLRHDLGWVAQRNNTWSMHVHMGIRGADRAIAVCDWLRGAAAAAARRLRQLALPRPP